MVGVTVNECPRCQGEGVLLSAGRPGEFLSFEESFLPSEALHTCPDCFGEGEIEVCADCSQPFTIQRGREVCGCAELVWLDAA